MLYGKKKKKVNINNRVLKKKKKVNKKCKNFGMLALGVTMEMRVLLQF